MIRKFTRLTMLLVATIGLSFSSFAQATDLFISEYGEPAGGNHKYIEIYNATGASVDLADYEIWKISNGGSWPGTTEPLSGWLLDNDVFVICNNQADASILAVADLTLSNTMMQFNGNDAIGLAKDNGSGTFVLIDAVGEQGTAAYWDVAGTTTGTQNHTLIRKGTVCSPDTNWSVTAGTTVANSQWIVMPANDWTDVGMHTSTCAASTSNDTINPEIIDGDFISATSLVLTFSEPVTSASATDVNNYIIAPGITVSSAVLSSSLDMVTLSLGAPGFVDGTQYSVAVMNVTDTSGNANVMDPFAIQFYYNSYSGSDIKITEIMYGQNGSGVQDIDYFEIYNAGTTSIPLAGLSVTSGMDLNINTPITLAAGDYYIFTEDVDSFMLAFPTITNVIGVDGGSLSGGGETIEISNILGAVVESVSYMTSAPWPGYSGTESTELCDLTSDNTDGANWYNAGTVSSTVADMLYGTPGSANSCAALPIISTYAIATVRTIDANGESDSNGVYCALEGIVHGVNIQGGGLSFFIIDETQGINVFNYNTAVDNYVVTEGDELRVVGEITTYRGLIEIEVDSITVLSTGNCISYPTIVDSLGESTESEYIEFINVTISDPSQWPTSGSRNVDFITANGDTLTMRIDSDTDIADSISNAPSATFNLIGIGGQFTFNSPALDGYQIFPMFVTDFDTIPSTVTGLFLNEVMVDNQTVIADGQGDFDSWIEIYNSTSNPIDLTGLLIGTEEPYRFSRCAPPVFVPANGFTLLWADDEMADGPTHLPFELSNEDDLGLATKNLVILDTLEWDSALTDVSLGHDTDGSGVIVSFEGSTPDATNANGIVLSVIQAHIVNGLNVYPNPTTTGNINFTKVVSFTMYSITGQKVMIQNEVNRVDVSTLDNGIYIIETTEGEVVKVIVK